MRGVRITAVHGNAVRRRQQGRLRLRLFPGGLLRLRLGSGRSLLLLGIRLFLLGCGLLLPGGRVLLPLLGDGPGLLLRVLRRKCRRGQQRQAQGQDHEPAQQSFLHRSPPSCLLPLSRGQRASRRGNPYGSGGAPGWSFMSFPAYCSTSAPLCGGICLKCAVFPPEMCISVRRRGARKYSLPFSPIFA